MAMSTTDAISTKRHTQCPLYYTCQSESEAVYNTRPWQLISSANYYLLLTTLLSGQHKTSWRSDNR